jgi:hypothetical protein
VDSKTTPSTDSANKSERVTNSRATIVKEQEQMADWYGKQLMDSMSTREDLIFITNSREKV